jgi:hypothetical protein
MLPLSSAWTRHFQFRLKLYTTSWGTASGLALYATFLLRCSPILQDCEDMLEESGGSMLSNS